MKVLQNLETRIEAAYEANRESLLENYSQHPILSAKDSWQEYIDSCEPSPSAVAETRR